MKNSIETFVSEGKNKENKVKMLIGSSIRYLAGRKAVTTYWRTTKDHASGELRIIKHQKICNFTPKEELKRKM